MEINAYKDNPVIRTQEQYWELERKLKAAVPTLYRVTLYADRAVIENRTRRTWRYVAAPTINWIVDKAVYMERNGM